MTITYDPHHPEYLDEADVRNELTRAFQICHGCRACVALCASFPTLFDLVDRFDDHDAGRLTPAEQDQVIGACHQCKLCVIDCPYTPDRHESALDIPRLMLRADAMRLAAGHRPARHQVATRAMSRTGVVGAIGSVAAPLTNVVIRSRQGSLVRTAVANTIGVSSVRLLPPLAKQRFSAWFGRRVSSLAPRRRGRVTVFPTCLVEYHDVQIGRDLVGVYERNGIECGVTSAGCCGAPWLHSGDIEHFAKFANENVRTLANEIRRGGGDIVVPEPACGYVLRNDYVDHVDPALREDAEFVAEHTSDACEYLVNVHTAPDTELDTDFGGSVPHGITYHVACHLRAQDIGATARDLMRLTGAEVRLVEQCSGIGGTWGFRDGNEETSLPMAAHLAERIAATAGDAPGRVVAGACTLANTAIEEQTGNAPVHPISVLARAYGIDPD